MVGTLTMPTSAASTAAPTAQPKSDGKLRSACQEFAGELFSMMLKEMRKTVPDDKLIGDSGHQQEIYTEMMDDKVAQEMSKQGGTNGLGDQIYNQLSGHRAYAKAAQAVTGGVPPTAAGQSVAATMIPLNERKSNR